MQRPNSKPLKAKNEQRESFFELQTPDKIHASIYSDGIIVNASSRRKGIGSGQKSRTNTGHR